MRTESYKTGAVKLMVAGFIVRIFGFINRIYMSNLLGAEGMGLFQLSSPVYSLIILTLTAGVSVTVSSMCAREMAKGNKANAIKITKSAFTLLLVSGSVLALVLGGFAEQISEYVLHDIRVRYSLIMLCPCIPIVASASAIKGYFYGTMRVTATAISQIVEQIVRIAVIFIVAPKVINESLEMACAIATVSAAIGEMANLAVVGIAFLHDMIKSRRQIAMVTYRQSMVEIGKASLPVSVNRLIVSIVGAVESVLLPLRFAAGGLDTTSSLEMLGRISGMCMPLITFPTLVTSSLATTLVPAIAQSIQNNDIRSTKRKVNTSVSMSLLMGAGFFAVFLIYGEQIGDFLYSGQRVGPLLCAMSSCCIFIYLQQVLSGVFHGLEKQTTHLIISLLGCGIRIGFIWFAVPARGVDGYITGTIISMLITTVISFVLIVKYTRINFDFKNWILKPVAIFTAVCVSGRIMSQSRFSSGTLGFLFSVSVSCLTALCLLVTMSNNAESSGLSVGKRRSLHEENSNYNG